MPNKPHPSQRAVLVIDDDQDIVQVLEAILQAEGYQVDVASDGMDGLSRIQAHNYDAVICDMMMPRMRGDTLYGEIVRCLPWMSRRFLFVSGLARSPDKAHFFSQPNVLWLEKPFHPDEVMQIVREIIAENAE